MKMRILISLLSLSLVACASRPYLASDPAQFKRDSWECTRDSGAGGGGTGLVGALMIMHARSQSQKLYDQCMAAKGYRRDG